MDKAYLMMTIMLVFSACAVALAAPGSGSAASPVISLDGPGWVVAADPKNVGREGKWWESPRPDAKSIRVPGMMQEALPGSHGVAWYWREVSLPRNPCPDGRYLLRFWMVDYLADVWVNDTHVGHHEGGEDAFILDITKACKGAERARIAVRVLNPTPTPIDDIELGETPRVNKWSPFAPGSICNYGGITDSVELLVTPSLWLEDLFVRPDPKSGVIHIRAQVRNFGDTVADCRMSFAVSPATSGETLGTTALDRKLSPGETVVDAQLKVTNPHIWDLGDPYLYRVTASVRENHGRDAGVYEVSTRCGFRDFRFENGCFRLNGRRIFLRSSHGGCAVPIYSRIPVDPGFVRQDLLNCKVMGFNMIRFIASLPRRYVLDLCDEIGLMVYQENFASWGMGWSLSDKSKLGSDRMLARWDHSTAGMIKRDRNHPSIVMWGLLNENFGDAMFGRAVKSLPMVRALDDTRVVILNSGRFDEMTRGSGLSKLDCWNGGTISDANVVRNPGPESVAHADSTWPPGALSLHPGAPLDYSAIRWTAPSDGDYSISAEFAGLATKPTTTSLHALHNGSVIFEGFINLRASGNTARFAKSIVAKKGDTLDFVVGPGNKDPNSDTTGLTLVIKSGDGKIWNAASDFSADKNPNGTWSYGWLPAADAPDPSKFTLCRNARSAKTGPVGDLSNPGSVHWQDVLADKHPYQGVPHTAQIINTLRTIDGAGLPLFVSEYGVGSAIDLARLTRHFEQAGHTDCEDAQVCRKFLDRFMEDWKGWNLEDTFASPEDYFRQCLSNMAGQRLLGINALRANPSVVGYNLTGTYDVVLAGEGLTTEFRELKPGTIDALFEAFYPLRLCLFAEPVNAYRGGPVKLEAVLANEDQLRPGEYPVRLQVVGPDNKRFFERTITVRIPDKSAGSTEAPFAQRVFSEDVVIDGPTGKYRFLAAFERGGAAAGGETQFYVVDPADMPRVNAEVVMFGDDPELEAWLKSKGVRTRKFEPGEPSGREVILASHRPPAGDDDVWRELARRIARGSTAIFLCPEVFRSGDDPVRWVPLANKGAFAQMSAWVYHKDEWAKKHPIFDGMPTGLLDYTVYRELIRDKAWAKQDVPTEVVAGCIDTSLGYSSGLMISVNKLGAGKFILTAMWLRENLGKTPWADRLVLNMINYAGAEVGKPLMALPDGFDESMRRMGY